MRFIWAFPIAFVAGIHGFAMFAPYLLTVVSVGLLLRNRKQKQPARAAVRVTPIPPKPSQASPAYA